MKGKIGVESKQGEGSRFWFALCLEKQTQTAQPVISTVLSHVRVLVVDDSETNRTALANMLTTFECRPFDVGSGRKAVETLKYAKRTGDPFRIALIDMQMPEMNGEETARAIKNDPEISETQIIILTSIGIRGDAARLEGIGCAGYLLKPINQNRLPSTRRRTLQTLSTPQSRLQNPRRRPRPEYRRNHRLFPPPKNLLNPRTKKQIRLHSRPLKPLIQGEIQTRLPPDSRTRPRRQPQILLLFHNPIHPTPQRLPRRRLAQIVRKSDGI